MDRVTGRYVDCTGAGEVYRAWIPADLPPVPPIPFGPARLKGLEAANLALGRLDGISGLLPSPTRLLYAFIRKEAVLSSQIEGTQSSLSDLLEHEARDAPGSPDADVEEVSCYIRAVEHGQVRLAEGFPLCLRLLKEIHEKLLTSARGANKSPGEFRRSPVWLGGTRPGNALFVPPPAPQMMDCLGALERYLHVDDEAMPPLLRAGLVHVQFETIHPFLDGNGRIGRLLIVLMLMEAGILKLPLLYLSLYFKANRGDYYLYLQRVRTHGDWEGWIDYFLRAVAITASEAVRDIQRILDLFEQNRVLIAEQGRKSAGLAALHEHLCQRPVTNIALAQSATDMDRTTVARRLKDLIGLGLVRKLSGQKRNQLFAYDPYLAILSEGTEPLEP